MKNKKNIIISILFFSILFFGVFLRLWQLGYSSYWLDEGFTLMQARGIAEHGYPLLDSGFIEWKDLLVPYLIAPLVKIFGFERAWILRLPSAIFGIMTIIVSYGLAQELFYTKKVKNDKKFIQYSSLLFAFFMATCYWYVAWSQQIRGYSALIFFILLFFYFLAKHNNLDNGSKHINLLVYAFGSIVLAILTKKFAIILFPSFLFYLFAKKRYKTFLFFAIPSTVIIFYFINNVGYIFSLNDGNHFLFYIKEYLFKYFGVVGILGWFGIIMMFLTEPKQKILNGSIVLFMVSSVVVFSMFIFVSEGRYLLMITPFFFLYTVYFIGYIAKNFKAKVMVGAILAGIVIIISFLVNQNMALCQQVWLLINNLGSTKPSSSFST